MIAQGPNRRGVPSPSILAVDDEPLNRDLLKRVLGNDYDVRESGDAASARAALAERPACVVLADLIMPNESGVDLLRGIRKTHPQVVGVLLTGADEEPMVLEALADGAAFAVIGKPWRSANLLEQVKRAVGEAIRRCSTD